MEIIASLITVILPFVVKHITNVVKKVEKISLSDHKKSLLRIFVGIVSLSLVIANGVLTGTEVDTSVLEELSLTILTAISATGLYYFDKYRASKAK